MAIHHRWTTMNKHAYYGEHSYGGIRRQRPIYLMAWRQSYQFPTSGQSLQHGMHNVSIYFRRGEDILIEFVPNIMVATDTPARQDAALFNVKAMMGQPVGVWNIDEWQRIDNEGAATM
eukprot:6477242-Amphidinium_carterae.3